MNHLQTNLRGIELELGELETRLRYYSTKAKSHRPGSPLGNELEQQLSELDEEISRCRNTLEELRSRKKVVRTELAKVRPDGTADKVTCLADGRATLRMLEQTDSRFGWRKSRSWRALRNLVAVLGTNPTLDSSPLPTCFANRFTLCADSGQSKNNT